jgi:hypothetical protein
MRPQGRILFLAGSEILSTFNKSFFDKGIPRRAASLKGDAKPLSLGMTGLGLILM